MCFSIGFSLNVSWVFIKQTLHHATPLGWGILENKNKNGMNL
jgi:hypothetical protein